MANACCSSRSRKHARAGHAVYHRKKRNAKGTTCLLDTWPCTAAHWAAPALLYQVHCFPRTKLLQTTKKQLWYHGAGSMRCQRTSLTEGPWRATGVRPASRALGPTKHTANPAYDGSVGVTAEVTTRRDVMMGNLVCFQVERCASAQRQARVAYAPRRHGGQASGSECEEIDFIEELRRCLA